MKGKRRLTAVLGIALVALLGVAACGPDDDTDTPDAATTSAGATAEGSAIECATGSINGSGSSAQKNAMDEWVTAYEVTCPGADINYQATSSGAGRQAFINRQVDFAGSDSAIKDDQETSAAARCTGGTVVDLPMVVGPVAIVYNLSGVNSLKLSPSTIARIFSGAVTRWNDPAITAENAGVSLPDVAIASVHRSDSSGTTDNFTKFLTGAGGADWTFGSGSDWKAPGGRGAQGSEGLTATVKSTEGAIGYVELSYAENAGLSAVAVRNAAGEYVDVSSDAASKGLSSAKIGEGADLVLTFDYTTATPGAYPVYLVSYEIVCTAGIGENGALVKSFLAYTASEAGQASVADLGYAPLPPEVAARVQGVIATLTV
ncbi:phosphate ABC transporter substrate-binding protein PstS [Frankia sp. CNm7]|uniref:Phosphate-binding protein n=1 Tax=Frankia nepalensis TaxID=1836974 RepID=A0A937RFA7_9ACTN|nr:phosphate ABC transporter substrate-binding protein PstS [Frankia nepalensis]MBL7496201.1 phosphate ABC transporter substrate-binding protein PstS [Frankia nepalensis]MBL7511660.1 phosphate ABC transporter substrate-binding protein PstS [Frankia nepalensis]MBL7523224.1 phosphate ABC transporter substrate-binding protein PstS [Frankia nepalensis]MBL7631098.1 phosphate ABC transporter substrate-binding protein PstS [Frankia nepalensis]